jgi:hypothetical protein
MADTYDTLAEAEADRAQQKALLTALGGWDRALRRDECGAWTISGGRGSIHTYGDNASWILYVACRSTLHWTHTKRRLTFCEMLLDCEDEHASSFERDGASLRPGAVEGAEAQGTLAKDFSAVAHR